jgi:hypothetical protein
MGQFFECSDVGCHLQAAHQPKRNHYSVSVTQLFPILSSSVSNMNNNQLLSASLIAATAIAGVTLQATAATAQIASNSPLWNDIQPTISSGASVGFNHQLFQPFVQQEGVALPNSGQKFVNANNLYLKHNYNVKVSFINEGAGYLNQLAYTAAGTTNQSGLLFKNISCSGSYDGAICANSGGGGPLLQFGDTVSLGNIQANTQLDFLLKSNGANRSDGYVFGTQAGQNADGLQHVVAYTYGSKYLLLGFEDLYGTGGTRQGLFNEKSDRDFNDTVFVVDIGEDNVACLNAGVACTKTPEPAAAAGLIGLGLTAAVLHRRRG